MDESTSSGFTSSKRKRLFLEMATRPEGTTPVEAHREAQRQGDGATEEAYYNIARRLAHRGLLREDGGDGGRRYIAKPADEAVWLDEDDLWELVDPDYPLLALTVASESARQMRRIPEDVWMALQQELRGRSAREAFLGAILSYAQDFNDQVEGLIHAESDVAADDRVKFKREAQVTHDLLKQMTKFGLGISRDAIALPVNLETAIAARKAGATPIAVDEALLRAELERRIADEPIVLDVNPLTPPRPWLTGAVDGSTRGGVLSFMGTEGDFVSGLAPLVSINTAVGQVNRDQRIGAARSIPTFTRLPERPEDMQREDNRFSVMAKMLYPDMSEGTYMHAVWNSMDLMEAKATLRLLSSWSAPTTHLEIPAADVVLRDGAVSPQDRDFTHYTEYDTYGRIVRDTIKVNWEIAKHCREDGQSVAGVIKNAQLRVLGPVINWLAAKWIAAGDRGFGPWPIHSMNLLPDQTVLTNLLTAGRSRSDGWVRTCLIVRPFHALTNFSLGYRRTERPSELVMEKHKDAMRAREAGALDAEREHFWVELFREEHDPYVQMMDHVSYGAFFLGAVARLDSEKQLPRFEFVVNASNAESGVADWAQINAHAARICSAVKQDGFDVAAEHTMFDNKAKLDVLPAMLIRVHDTVKHWSADLLSRVQEYIGFYVSRYVNSKRLRGATVRPFKKAEYELLYGTLKRERDGHAGAGGGLRSVLPEIEGDAQDSEP